ncbi:AGE family epimerase/isomerase [Microbacterium sp. TNHR37B]|uniref:AGE family epimerase/isomerase n=1 Tax=Microbacterium sp. TNHR37B TaxID=1775956 RepID=UPI0007B18922|nr:AGE family epimerase/isomerase [Microbacterium sp. TNHR37B]KZE90601.1 Sulfoquinovose isomerase [Microbacterium sp. TNHR37B]
MIPEAAISILSASGRSREARRLLAFPQPPFPPQGGAYWLDDDGRPLQDEPVWTWITARTAHVYGLAHLAGAPDARWRAEVALRGLRGPLRDERDGGWFESSPSRRTHKTAYTHAAVLLASTTALRAGLDITGELLRESLEVIDERFWDEEAGMSRDAMTRDWSSTSDYRGLNANMHLVEAYLAVPDEVSPLARQRALGICRRVVAWAEVTDWRLPEHFDLAWGPVLDYGIDRPSDPFTPFGSTPGHGFEWARLLAGASVEGSAKDAAWLREAALSLYDRAARDGWARDGEPGFVYTVDWEGRPVASQRLFWVAAEAVAAAEVLLKLTGDPRYHDDRRVWWRYIDEYLVDRERGSWRHELDLGNRPASTIWAGKPDLYHAYQACIVPDLPLSASVSEGVARARV